MMQINIRDFMIQSSGELSENAIVAFNENSAIFSEMMLALEMLNHWEMGLNNLDQNVVLKEVCYDMLSSLYISAQGMYRNAYICLRSALELGLSFIYFVDSNYEYLLWKVNDYDIKWSTLKDENTGVLSRKYLSLFLRDYDVQEFIENVKDTYRMCSEYVHGKFQYMHTTEGEKILHQQDKFVAWSSVFMQVAKLVNIILVIRFQDVANNFSEDKKLSLKEMLVDYHLGGILN
ncbi:hypothetical protein PaecuDRAFT_2062 [Paenibacillus curdlanolyticus YK9]|uniref:Uncharacterized protein n=1 Tax=Paenibacillus curdlanolyticus YK9 TaxID=717606 RepID=E0I8T1_9BACL|nr:hypothetical protein [Paenibacillus curdlanolyticus]EFM10815.1 hypothetical protein PaecuDRAFT_2062 [Paenibacillus curdlanolyticus YK9]